MLFTIFEYLEPEFESTYALVTGGVSMFITALIIIFVGDVSYVKK